MSDTRKLASNTAPPVPGSARDGAAVRKVFEKTLAAAAEKPEVRHAPETLEARVAAALQKRGQLPKRWPTPIG